MRPIRRQILSLALGFLVSAAAVLGLTGPAAAHDAAESSSPSPGASLPAPPELVSVTFNRNPLGIGASFSIKDSSGTEWADGPVEIVDNIASQKLRAGGPAGEYTVAWRVVSSDSHPIEGTFGFTAAAAGGPAAPQAAPATVPAAPAPAASAPAIGTAQPGSTMERAEPVDASEPFQWSIVIFAVVAVGLLAALAILARRRLTAASDE
ncbi:copper resistance CopC family protein [Pseudarthrobacter sp. NamE5]|uniref:copper resistance CopC family protein n=1 Tax=Pseudarthrobacter sp. NamE5 TaxID=2576839 RepID=UPI00110BD164|nr:copper resistance CopC family protein [Pseudarthrobacter sp. NamE5]TLM87022.1 copper resistance protein CopC [Pseudarthrobacter sp. NamE5]